MSGIKSDKWIRKQCGWHIDGTGLDELLLDLPPMIDPYAPGQVRTDKQGKKIISHGTSSYGYDVRCGREFKIFTNINSTMVDPKNFDEKCFVDHVGDYCIIPPNSFALARSYEYFNIPRDILTVCLGKSTLARCFTGDTKVALVNGTTISFKDMVELADKGERFWGYSVNDDGLIVVSELIAPRKIGEDKVMEITLDNGQTIRATSDHQFMQRNGSYVPASGLMAGMSLMPLYRTTARGYEGVYQPTVGCMVSTHTLADQWNIVNGVYGVGVGEHRHHVDHNRRNNNPTNLVRMNASEHHAHHMKAWTEEERAEHGLALKQAYEQRIEDAEWAKKYGETQAARARKFWNDAQYADARERLLIARLNVSEETRDLHRQNMLKRYEDPDERIRQGERSRKAWEGNNERREKQSLLIRALRIRDDITDKILAGALTLAGTIRGAARLLNCDRSTFRRFPEVMSSYHAGTVGNNHKVVSVKEIDGVHDVYCLTVPTHGNFALESGVFVKNCGIIVNVTPLEPEWSGHITLEFSNTTPLPAKIYAEEGCAQLLFFQADEDDVCHTSYKDRNGKYQGQTGITLPLA